MFERECHKLVLGVLSALNAQELRRLGCWFAGGTRIALELDEFRESRDVDFLCPAGPAFSELRAAIWGHGYRALFTDAGLSQIGLPREIRADQYGIRFPAVIAGAIVRVELICEARIPFGAPVQPAWSPVACLSIPDCFAEKLLANCDRWADRDTLSRDLLDIAALRGTFGPIMPEVWNVAEAAYRDAVRSDLQKAGLAFIADPVFQERCFAGLRIRDERRQTLLQSIEQVLEEARIGAV